MYKYWHLIDAVAGYLNFFGISKVSDYIPGTHDLCLCVQFAIAPPKCLWGWDFHATVRSSFFLDLAVLLTERQHVFLELINVDQQSLLLKTHKGSSIRSCILWSPGELPTWNGDTLKWWKEHFERATKPNAPSCNKAQPGDFGDNFPISLAEVNELVKYQGHSCS